MRLFAYPKSTIAETLARQEKLPKMGQCWKKRDESMCFFWEGEWRGKERRSIWKKRRERQKEDWITFRKEIRASIVWAPREGGGTVYGSTTRGKKFKAEGAEGMSILLFRGTSSHCVLSCVSQGALRLKGNGKGGDLNMGGKLAHGG